MDPRPPFHLYKEKSFTVEKYYFCVQSQNLRVTQDFLCTEPEVLPTTYKKISIVTKWGFFVTKFFGGVLGP